MWSELVNWAEEYMVNVESPTAYSVDMMIHCGVSNVEDADRIVA
jgi:FtsP/CotA-like multicopper oxidase with cupredoxin domain